ncbi:MAG: LEPR-XLL domain-containing protein, partial [Pelagimonas sp.]|nr:LEPR-XLL domain-containing protein [Pelagimonas sp.]
MKDELDTHTGADPRAGRSGLFGKLKSALRASARPVRTKAQPLRIEKMEPRLLLSADPFSSSLSVGVNLGTSADPTDTRPLMVRLVESGSDRTLEVFDDQQAKVIESHALGSASAVKVKVTGRANVDDRLVLDASLSKLSNLFFHFSGQGGADQIDLGARAAATVTIGDPDAGSGASGLIVNIAGDETLRLAGTVKSLTLSDLRSASDRLVLKDVAGANDGISALETGDGGALQFLAPTERLTILASQQVGNATAAEDHLQILSLDQSFDAGLRVSMAGAYDPFKTQSTDYGWAKALLSGGTSDKPKDTAALTNGASITLDGSLATKGGVTLIAETITGTSGSSIDTRASNGAAGAISLGGRMVSLNGVDLLAGVTSGGGQDVSRTQVAAASAGAITIYADDAESHAASAALTVNDVSASIDLSKSRLVGGTIKVVATSQDVPASAQSGAIVNSLSSAVPVQGKNAVLARLGWDNIGGAVLSRQADASVSLAQSQIFASGSVDVGAQTTVEANALVSPIKEGSKKLAGLSANERNRLGITVASAGSQVRTSLTGSVVAAAGDVTVLAKGKVKATSTVDLEGAFDSSSGFGLALTVGVLDLDADVSADKTSVVVSNFGDVNLAANGETELDSSANMTAITEAKGLAGIAIAVDTSDVSTVSNATIRALGSAPGNTSAVPGTWDAVPNYKFDASDPARVKLAQNAIVVPNHGLVHGQKVVYTAESNPILNVNPGASAIGGLKSGTSYYVDYIDSNTYRLLSSSPTAVQLDGSTAQEGAVHALSKVEDVLGQLGAVDPATNLISLVNHGFENGDLVTYTAGGTVLAGLQQGLTYTVNRATDGAFGLSLNGVDVDLTDASGLALGGQHRFAQSGADNIAELTLIGVKNGAITAPGHSFEAGDEVQYWAEDAKAATLGGLTNGHRYRVLTADDMGFTLGALTDNSPIAITAATAQIGRHGFAVVKDGHAFDARAQVNKDGDSIRLQSHGFKSGDLVKYTVAVGADDTPAAIQGLDAGKTYYVVVIDANTLRLVTEAPLATSQPTAIDLTALGDGDAHSFAPDAGLSTGVGIHASLSSSVAANASTESSKDPKSGNYLGFVLSGSEADHAAFVKDLDAGDATKGDPNATDPDDKADKTVKDESGKDVDTGGASSKFDLGGALAISVLNHNVKAEVGTVAGAGRIFSGQNVDVTAETTQATTLSAKSVVARDQSSNAKYGAALGINVGVYDNDTRALIGGHAQIDAQGTVKSQAKVTYPFNTPLRDTILGAPGGTFLSGLKTSAQADPKGAFENLMDGSLGLGSQLVNTWSLGIAKTENSSGTAIGGSVSVVLFDDSADARFASGARINTGENLGDAYLTTSDGSAISFAPSDTASVLVDAQVKRELVHVAGFGNWSDWVDTTRAVKDSSLKSAISDGAVIDFFSRSGGAGYGGALQFNSYDTTVNAVIEGGTHVVAGNSGALDVKAAEVLTEIVIVQSGSQTDSDGNSMAGSVDLKRARSSVRAAIEAGAGGTSTVIRAGSVSVSALSDIDRIAIAGTPVSGGAGGSTVGVSGTLGDIQRDTIALIGTTRYDGAAQGLPPKGGVLTLNTTGNVTVSALSTGVSFGIAIAGTSS